jgi:hypothetical protein
MRVMCWLAAAMLAFGQPKKSGSVEGSVVNAVTGAPVKRASVTLLNSKGRYRYLAVSDDSGRFRVAQVEPAEGYVAEARAQGFMMPPPSRQARSERPPVDVGEEQAVKELVIKLIPLGAIAGKVVDPEGEPVRGASVRALRYRYSPAGKRLEIAAEATTDDRGQYRLFALEPGRYFLCAFFRQLPPAVSGPVHSTVPEEGFPLAWYPGGIEFAQAGVVPMLAGAEMAGHDFRLVRTPVYHVRGRIQGAGRSALAASACVTPDVDFNYTFPIEVRSGGDFDARGIPPGTWCLAAPGRSMFRLRLADVLVTVADRDVEGVLIAGPAPAQFDGTLRVDSATEVLPPAVAVSLRDLETGFNSATGAVRDDGTFTLVSVASGRHQVHLEGLAKGMYLKMVRLGERELSSGIAEVTAPGGRLSLVIGADAGDIEGTVQDADGKPAGGAMVTLAPKGELAGRSDLIRLASAGDDGSFRVSGVAPGDYAVFAWDTFDERAAMAPEFLKLFGDLAATVTLAPSGKASAQLKSIPAGEIENREWKGSR